jgi:hypothetical protein
MARRPQTWLADVLVVQRDLTPDAEALAMLVRMLGLPAATADAPVHPPEDDARPPTPAEPSTTRAPTPDSRPEDADDEAGASTAPLPKIISTLTRVAAASPETSRPVWFDSAPRLTAGTASPRRGERPLFGRVQRRSILSYALSTDVAEGPVDVARIIRRVAQRQPLRVLPRLPRRTLRFGAEVLLDRSLWMAPYFREQAALVDYIRTLLPTGRLTITPFSGTPRWRTRSPAPGEAASLADPRRAIVALSDVGIGYRFAPQSPPSIDGWTAFGRAAVRAGRRFVTFAPYHRSRWPVGLGRDVPLLHWSERTTVADAARLGHGGAHRPSHEVERTVDARSVEDPVLTLARLLSPAVRVDPWLLRECRLTLAPQLDVGVEADLWFSDLVSSRGPSGFVLDPSIANALRDQLRQQDDLVVDRAAALAARAHEGHPTSVIIEEQLNALSVRRAVTDAAVEALLRPALKSIAGTDRGALDVARWASHAWGRLSSDVQATPSARQLAFAAAMRLRHDQWLRTAGDDAPEMPGDMGWLLPPDVDEMLVGLEVRRWPDGQVGLHIVEPSMVTNAQHHLRVPRTQPAWIQVGKAGDDETSASALLPAEIGASLPLPMPPSDGTRWSVRTLTGDRFELALPPQPAAYGFSLVTIAGTVGEPGRDAHGVVVTLTGVLVAPGLVVARLYPFSENVRVVVSTRASSDSYEGIVRRHQDGATGAVWVPRLRRSARLEQTVPLDPVARAVAAGARPNGPEASTASLVVLQSSLVAAMDLRQRGEIYVSDDPAIGRQPLVIDGGLVVPDESNEPYGLVAETQTGQDAGTRLRVSPLSAVITEARARRRQQQRCYIAYQRGAAENAHALHKALSSRLGSSRVIFDRGSQFPDEPHPSTLPTGVTALDAYLWVGPPPPAANMRRELEHIRALHIPLLWIPLEEKPDDALKEVPPGLEDLFNERCWLAPPGLRLPLDGAAAGRLAEAIARWDPWEQDAPSVSEAPPEPVRSPTLAKRVGTGIREQLIERVDNRAHATELYHTPLLQPFARRAFVVPRGPEPILLLVHARMSDTEGSFGSLWDVSNLALRERLASFYGDRVLAFDYRSVSQSLIESTIALAERLPAHATLHLLTLSAGGLIGELLSRGERTDGQAPFDNEDFAFVDTGRESDRPALRELSGLLQRKPFRLERFVRVACPARGSTFYQDAPEKAIQLLSSPGAILSAPMALLTGQIGKPLRALFADDRLSPAIGDLYPTSALIRLLNRPDVHSRSDLAIVTGIAKASGLWSTLKMLSVDMFHRADNDVVVLASSTTGGVRRTNGARILVDRGAHVTHFNYFRNASTLHPIVDALLRGSDAVPAFTLARDAS